MFDVCVQIWVLTQSRRVQMSRSFSDVHPVWTRFNILNIGVVLLQTHLFKLGNRSVKTNFRSSFKTEPLLSWRRNHKPIINTWTNHTVIGQKLITVDMFIHLVVEVKLLPGGWDLFLRRFLWQKPEILDV